MATIFSSLTLLMFLAVFIPQIRHDYWIFKVLEYPRLQKLFIVLVLIVVWMMFFASGGLLEAVSLVMLLVSAGYLVYKIFPYTVLQPREMKSVRVSDSSRLIKIFTANVYQDNNQFHRLLQQIRGEDPDIIFLVETDHKWEAALSGLEKDYPFLLKEPLDNTYGALFYSRLPLTEAKIRHLVKDDIPSVCATVRLRNGQLVKLWGLHPEPPVPNENLYATAKDKELMKVAFEVRDAKLPCIVFGDLNDVAWSHTTELFRKTGNLLDPRRGRGFYATFSAYSWFMRFPLDYIFCSSHFGLISMKRLPKNGSDHFATCTHLAYMPEIKAAQDPPDTDAAEITEAAEKAARELPENG